MTRGHHADEIDHGVSLLEWTDGASMPASSPISVLAEPGLDSVSTHHNITGTLFI